MHAWRNNLVYSGFTPVARNRNIVVRGSTLTFNTTGRRQQTRILARHTVVRPLLNLRAFHQRACVPRKFPTTSE